MLAGSIYPVIGEFEKAALQATEGERLAPDRPLAYVMQMDAYLALDRFDDARAAYARAHRLGLHSGFFTLDLYQLAFLQNDPAEMARQVAASRGQDFEDTLIAYEADTAAYSGHLTQARELSEQAMNLAQRTGNVDSAATYGAASAVREALFGNAGEAERRARSALARAPARDVQFAAALAFAFAGNDTQAAALTSKLADQYPEDTLVRFNYLPALRARRAIARGDANEALALLKTATSYELGITRSSRLNCMSLYPIYMRGAAYRAAGRSSLAADEFQRILDHSGIAVNCPIGPMARLQRARALVEAGDRAGATVAYKTFLDLWKNADPDVPVLNQARAEYARLN